MAKTSFDTNPVSLQKLLEDCEAGDIQLPDFQRSWVWEEDRILSLIASVSLGFPMGALMTLKARADASTLFAYRTIQGAPALAKPTKPEQLLLDGQQRMTSLYQSCMRKEVVETISAKKRLVRRWFYIDIRKALTPGTDREVAIFTLPEDRKVKENFDRDVVLDLSTAEQEYSQMMYPLRHAFDWDSWQEEFGDYWIKRGEPEKRGLFQQFKNDVLKNFGGYQVPVIALGADTSHEAVCLVFEKVNTGGKALDAFELLTAMYAAQGYKLRDDWLGNPYSQDALAKLGLQKRLAQFGRAPEQSAGVLANVGATDFLQAVALLHSKELRTTAMKDPKLKENDWPAVRATRQSLLDLPLSAYVKYRDAVRTGFEGAARFLRQQQVHRATDLPYQTQLVPLAAILADIGDRAEHVASREKLARWYWCGVFGELYGSAVESRFAKDIVEVPAWMEGGTEPDTVRDGVLRADRLLSMRSRLSAAYKGLHALLMREGARDFRSGQAYDQTVFFDEAVDIHHVFPKAWCEAQKPKLLPGVYDSVVNKTPLAYRTNRIIGGVAPSKYLRKLEDGREQKGQVIDPPITAEALNGYLESHSIPVDRLRADDFEGFIVARQQMLLGLVAKATGHDTQPAVPSTPDDGVEMPVEIAQDTGFEVTEPD